MQKANAETKVGDLVSYQDQVGILLQEGDDPFDGALFIDLFTDGGYHRIWIEAHEQIRVLESHNNSHE